MQTLEDYKNKKKEYNKRYREKQAIKKEILSEKTDSENIISESKNEELLNKLRHKLKNNECLSEEEFDQKKVKFCPSVQKKMQITQQDQSIFKILLMTSITTLTPYLLKMIVEQILKGTLNLSQSFLKKVTNSGQNTEKTDVKNQKILNGSENIYQNMEFLRQ
jgi:hypothetical protein